MKNKKTKKKKLPDLWIYGEFRLYRGLYRESGQIHSKAEKTKNRDNLIELFIIGKCSRGIYQVHKQKKSPRGIFDSRRKKKVIHSYFSGTPPRCRFERGGVSLFLGTFFLPDLLCGAEKLKADGRTGFVSGSRYDGSSRQPVGPKNKKIRAILNFYLKMSNLRLKFVKKV